MERNKWTITEGKIAPLGISKDSAGVYFTVEVPGECTCSLVLYRKGESQREAVIPFPMEYRIGNLYTMCLKDFMYEEYEYTYEIDGVECPDPYAISLTGRRTFGKNTASMKGTRCGFWEEDYAWEGDVRLQLPMHEVVLYTMHVRGYTKHISSGVEHRGTYRGIIEKIPYMKQLGINQIELMPVYEFDEIIAQEQLAHPEYHPQDKKVVNYWGYAQTNYYFAVKKSFASSDHACTEFKDLVKTLHQNGIEVIMEIYFPMHYRLGFVTDCLKFWKMEYHVDGFHLTGEALAVDEILRDPVLADVKIYSSAVLNVNRVENLNSGNRRIYAVNNIDYLIAVRSFLKGDFGQIERLLYAMRRNEEDYGFVNYVTSHDGFTLLDLVSYDHKHNDENLEGGMDGWDYNYSWNCGVEGTTRKQHVWALRRQQMKNAWVLLLFSQGIPAILAGDEWGNSQHGNNNAYCQDNATGWLNWKELKPLQQMSRFVRQLLQIRREHPVLHMPQPLKLMDEKGTGYPDLSYHSEKAWYLDMHRNLCSFGALYCGDYATSGDRVDDFFYIAANMYWNDQKFAVPDIPKERKWFYLINTAKEESVFEETEVFEGRSLSVKARSIIVLIGRKKGGKSRNKSEKS